jgi:hypothetical protein
VGVEGLTAGAAARRLGVAVTTLRTWHQRYGLGPSHHVPGQHRRYTSEDMSRLQVMRRLTAQGVTPAEAAAWARRAPVATATPAGHEVPAVASPEHQPSTDASPEHQPSTGTSPGHQPSSATTAQDQLHTETQGRPPTGTEDQYATDISPRGQRPVSVSAQGHGPAEGPAQDQRSTGLPTGGLPTAGSGTADPSPAAAGPRRPAERDPAHASKPEQALGPEQAPGRTALTKAALERALELGHFPEPENTRNPDPTAKPEQNPPPNESSGPEDPDQPTFTRLGDPRPGSLTSIDLAWPEVTGRHFAARDGGGHTLHTGRAGPAARGLARAAMRLDGPALRDILELAVVDRGVIAAWDEVILPVLIGIGERYAATKRFIEVEHLISRGVTEVLAAVTRPPSAHLPRVLLAAADEEQHTLPLEALAAALAQAGVPSRFLGGRVPPRALRDAVARTGPVAVVLWSQMPSTGNAGQWTHLLSGPHRPLLAAAAGPGWSEAELPDDVTTVSSLVEAVRLVSMAARPADQAN